MAVIEDSFTPEERQWVEQIGGYDERQGEYSSTMDVYFDEDWSYYVSVRKITPGLFECCVYGTGNATTMTRFLETLFKRPLSRRCWSAGKRWWKE